MSISMDQLAQLQDEESRRHLGRLVVALVDKWGLADSEQLEILALDGKSTRMLRMLREGERPLPYSPEVLLRTQYLLSIHKGLQLLFPEDVEARFGWVRMSNELFDGETPLEIMLREGIDGVAKVARYVEAQLYV